MEKISEVASAIRYGVEATAIVARNAPLYLGTLAFTLGGTVAAALELANFGYQAAYGNFYTNTLTDGVGLVGMFEASTGYVSPITENEANFAVAGIGLALTIGGTEVMNMIEANVHSDLQALRAARAQQVAPAMPVQPKV